MSANLISSIAQVLGSNVIARIASSLGIDRSQADKAVQAGVPGLLAALVSLVSRPDGASALNGAIAQQQPALLSNLSNVVGGPTQNSLIDSGMSTLNSLLGNSTTSLLTNAVGQFVGLGGNASKNLLGLLAPVVMGVLGQEQRKNGLDADGLADLLESQKDNITRALPAGFSKYLGGTGILDGLMGDERATSTSATSARPGFTTSSAGRYAVDPNASSSQWRWVLPALAVLALLGIAWNLRTGSSPEQTAVTTPPATTETPAASGTNTATAPSSTGASTGVGGADVMPAPFQALDNLRGIKVGDTDVGAQLASAVDGMRASLSSIKDEASAQAAVQPLSNSASEFSRLNKLLGQLSPDVRKTVVNTIVATRPTLDQLCDKALAIPGVSALIKPTVDSIRSEFNTLSTA
jgi:hypothetical protein